MGDHKPVGFSQLPCIIQKRSLRKGFQFTLMVVGEHGLGKSTLINSLFKTEMYPERCVPSALERIHKTIIIEPTTVEIEEDDVKVKLTIVDTPGYGDSLNSSDCFEKIFNYIDDQFKKYFVAESTVHRRYIVDSRVHACLYVISPFGHGLKPIDLECLKMIHKQVNLIPVIAKADALTRNEIKRLRSKVLKELLDNEITFYTPEEHNLSMGENYYGNEENIMANFPFAVCGSNVIVGVGDSTVSGRLYPWGFLDVENPKFCDLQLLRQFIICRMQDLLEETHEVIYESYRLKRISSTT